MNDVERDNDQDDDEADEHPFISSKLVYCLYKLWSFLQEQDNISDEAFSALFKIKN